MIVDFWAPWCGPCKTLGPALEKAVTAAKGKVKLVKIDVDQNQRIAAQMRVQSIPAVFAFVGGQPVDGFIGRAVAGAGQGLRRPAAWRRRAATPASRRRSRHGRGDARRGRGRGRGADLRGGAGRGRGQRRGARRARAGHLALGDVERAREILALAPKGKATTPAIARGARRRSSSPRRAPTRARSARSRPRSSATPTTTRRATTWRMALVGKGDAGGRDRRSSSSSSGATASGTRRRQAQLFKLFDSLGPEGARRRSKGRRRLSLDDLRLTRPAEARHGEAFSTGRPAGDDPGLPAARRAAAAAARGCRSTSSSRAISRCSTTR